MNTLEHLRWAMMAQNSAPGWTPYTEAAYMNLWYRSDDYVSLSGSKVNAANDRGSANLDVTFAATPSDLRPTFVTNSLNGKPAWNCLNTTRSNISASVNYMTGTQPMIVVYVANPPSPGASTFRSLFFLQAPAENSQAACCWRSSYINFPGYPQPGVIIARAVESGSVGFQDSSLFTAPHYLIFYYNNGGFPVNQTAKWAIYKNGVSQTLSTYGSAGNSPQSVWGSTSVADNMQGPWYEWFVLKNRTLDSTLLDNIRTYMYNRYALGTLP